MEYNSAEKRRVQMLSTPMKKLIPAIALPSIVSMLIGAIYNMADTFFVGQLGNSATGAIGIVLPITNLLQAISFIFAHGATSYVSRLLGSDKRERAGAVVVTSLFNAMALGLVYGTAGIAFMHEILLLFGSTDTILPYAKEYALYIYIASPFFAGSYVLSNTLRAEGGVMKALIGISSGAVLNIILDPIFIFTLNLGVAGAGIATAIGQMFGFFVLLYFYIGKGRHKSALQLKLGAFSPELSMYREILKIGIPSFFRLALNSLAAVLLNTAAANYGDAAIAAFSIVSRVVLFVNYTLIGYGQGYQPISGYNYGAGAYRRVEEAYRFTWRSAFLFMLASGALLFIYAKPLITSFRNDAAVVEIGAAALRYQAAALPLASVTLVASMFFQSTGKALPALITVLSRQGLFFVPLILILPQLFALTGLEVAQAAADTLAFFVSAPIAIFALKELRGMKDLTEQTL